MSKAARYRVVEVHRKPKHEDVIVTYRVQRHTGLFMWKVQTKMVHSAVFGYSIKQTATYDTLEAAVRAIKDWHNELYAETWTKTKTVKHIEFRIPNW